MINKKINITESEVFNIAFNRNLSQGLIKQTQIEVAEEMWVKQWIGEDFYNSLVTDEEDDYYEFIDKFIKPIIAWGTLYNNFDYISQNITDKGILQMFVEGGATIIDRDSRFDAKMEILRTVYMLIKRMQRYGLVEKQENELFKNFEINEELKPSIVKFYGKQRLNLKPH